MMAAEQQLATATVGELFGDDAPPALAGRSVSGLAADSRRVTPGGLFLACAGRRSHGLDHVAEALARGAALVAWEPVAGRPAPALISGAECFPVVALGRRSGEIADVFFGRPSASLAVVGFTGTNGKTTCTQLVGGALEAAGRAAGVIGTLGAGRVGGLVDLGYTTPDAVEVHRTLAAIRDAGGEDVAMEVSSHALDQGRVAGVRFRVAAFTNLSRDHLDYHGTLEAYAAAKLALFRSPGLDAAVVNGDDPLADDVLAQLGSGTTAIVVGRQPGGRGDRRLEIEALEHGPAGLTVSFGGSWGQGRLRSPLWGEFNGSNLALALGVLLALGLELGEATDALGSVRAPAGRMELFVAPRPGPRVIVDYAHTPDALAQALAAVRAHCEGRVWCVFGCGGERDRGKRPEMGAVAEQLADEIVVTDDNPRGEAGDAIVAQILAGMERRPRVERDRRAAITLAVAEAGPDDVVLVAGKGHEDYQLVAGERRAFSDRALVRELLEGRS
jgi:UDP-N-acetylmuramoyl-L-alanyl-D-glutamate--2,6-diaminopimelate ligase